MSTPVAVNEALDQLRRIVDQLSDEPAHSLQRYELSRRLESAFTELENLLTPFRTNWYWLGRKKSRARHSRADTVEELLVAIRKAEDSATLIGAISAASEVAALAEKWMLQLIGAALAAPEGPSWGEVGRALKRLDKDGGVVAARISRQAARQRFAGYAVVEHHRLTSRADRLRREIAAFRDQLRLIQADTKRNDAEKRRDADVVGQNMQKVELLLHETEDQLKKFN